MKKITVKIDRDWINLDIPGDIRMSFPLFGNSDKDKSVDDLAMVLKRAVRGERISTLN